MTLQNHGRPVLPAPGLEILVDADSVVEADGTETKGRGRRAARDAVTSVFVPTEEFGRSVEGAVAALQSVFERAAAAGSAFPLREAQVSFEISAKGGIQLIGTSEVQGKGAITLTFGAPGPASD
ncbi:hypothetical protein [Streptomyces sp. NPDC015131]|uniref:Pepco domain-containing protein n=1 Tax=Streptomyces sp. NPDC015131 TaxID=3364941 RepID=UPI0036F73E31